MAAGVSTADIMDDFAAQAIVLPAVYQHFGGCDSFHGPIVLVNCFEDNSKVKQLLEESGLCPQSGVPQVLVVNGQGSLRCALMGDMIAKRALENQWAGVIIDGAVRDTAILKTFELGICALSAVPRKSVREDRGEINPKEFYLQGERLSQGQYLYADTDGIVILPEPVHGK
jgi:regulator of ribonuclease activity A